MSAAGRGTPRDARARSGWTGCCGSTRARSAARVRSWTATCSTRWRLRSEPRCPARISDRVSARVVRTPVHCHHRYPHASVPVMDTPSRPVRSLRRTYKESPYVANIKSQIKRIGTNEKARLRNKAVKTELKTHVRRVREAVAAGDKDAATVALVSASRKLDKAASKGVIHANQAANKKSALAKAVASL